MLTRGGAPFQYGQTVLHAAAFNRHLEVVRFLVEQLGVDVTVEDVVTSSTLLPLSKSPELSALSHSLPFAGHPPPIVHPPLPCVEGGCWTKDRGWERAAIRGVVTSFEGATQTCQD